MNANPTGISRITTPPPCNRSKCGKPAACVPIIRIPAIGGTKENALSAPVKIFLCVECARRANVGEFLRKDYRDKLKRFCRNLGPARPDFKAAWLEWGPLPTATPALKSL